MAAQPSYRQAAPKRIAGARCLDFLNTIEWRGDPGAQGERLTGYPEFLAWAEAVELVSPTDSAALAALAAADPPAAAAALEEVRRARETLAALLDGRTGAQPLNALLTPVRFALRLEDGREVWRPDAAPLRQPLLVLLREAVALLASDRRAQIRSCANGRCHWFFLDQTRNRSRRWCEMASCGNSAKVRAHYHRHRATGGAAGG